MISEYFKDFDKKVLKKSKSKSGSKDDVKKGKKGAKQKDRIEFDVDTLKEMLALIIPSNLKIDNVKPISPEGFSPEGADLIVYREYCRDIVNIMGGYVPSELIYATIHLVPRLDKKSLAGVLNRIAVVKKINSFSDPEPAEKHPVIPSFIIAGVSDYSLLDLKNDVMNYYFSKSVEYNYEMDILLILRKGILVKNWREKRSFIGLETNDDTMDWAFILMNEYLDVEKNVEMDFRKYLKKDVKYNQY